MSVSFLMAAQFADTNEHTLSAYIGGIVFKRAVDALEFASDTTTIRSCTDIHRPSLPMGRLSTGEGERCAGHAAALVDAHEPALETIIRTRLL